MKFHCDSTLVALSSQYTSVHYNVAIVKSLILSLGVYCVPKISICSWFVAVENISGWWLDAFLVCLPSCGSLLFRWSEAQGEMPGSLGMEGREEEGGEVHVLDQRPDCPPLQLPTQQTSTRQFIRRGALRGEKWKRQNRKRWREAGESESYIIGRRTTNRKRKRAALTPPQQQQQPGAAIYFSLTARESPSGFWFRALTSASLQLPITAPSWRSKLTAGTPEWICDSKVWFNSLASLFTATALIIAAVLMLRSQGSDNGA